MEVFGSELSSKEKAVNILRAAALPGVGPATAERIADHFEGDLEQVMDSSDAVKLLSQVHKVGAKTAEKIKDAWDSTRGRATSLQVADRIFSSCGCLLPSLGGGESLASYFGVSSAVIRVAPQ